MRLDTIVSGFCLSQYIVKDNDEEKWGQSVALQPTYGDIKGFAGLPIDPCSALAVARQDHYS